MSFTIFQAGSTLYGMDARGSTAALTLPTGVTLDANARARFAVIGNFAVMVNSPNRPLTIDANLKVRVLTPDAPTVKPVLSGVTAGTLSGTYLARQTFIVRDSNGNLISESDFGPTADSVTIATKLLRVASVNLSTDSVSASRLYRTATGESVYFQWLDLEGNTQTTIEDDLSDAGLATLAAPSLGTPPNLSLVAEFKQRLFGVGKNNLNYFRYSEVGAPYAWPEDNVETLPRSGTDNRGITGFARRRDALGIARANGFFQWTGTSIITLAENCGIEAPDSVAVFNDVAFFLWKDGVYAWGLDGGYGLKNVSAGKVQRWFTRNGTFNLARLKYAFAQIDPLRKKYRLYLASAGSNREDCWIEYDWQAEKWWGPHMSHAFTPTAAFDFSTTSGLVVPMVGGQDGKCRLDRVRKVDDNDTGVDFDVVTARHDAGMPDDVKYFGELSVNAAAQPRGTMDVYATVGDLDQKRKAKGDLEDVDPPFTYDLTEGRQRLGRVGSGIAMKLRFRNNQPNEDVVLRGFEVTPVNPVGKR
jgi:hypothetical protein